MINGPRHFPIYSCAFMPLFLQKLHPQPRVYLPPGKFGGMMMGRELGFWGHTDQNALEAFLEAVPCREYRPWGQTI